MPGAMYEPNDAADYIKRSRRTLERLRAKGEVRATKIGGRTFYREEHLLDYLRKRDGSVPPSG